MYLPYLQAIQSKITQGKTLIGPHAVKALMDDSLLASEVWDSILQKGDI
jgi:hypothetical protein